MQLRIAHSLDELSQWRQQWDTLAAAQRIPMLHYAWFQAAEHALAEPGHVRVVYLLDENDALIAACALELRRDKPRPPCYQILGMRRLYEPSALLCRDATAHAALLAALGGLDRPIVLARLWPDAADTDTRGEYWWMSRGSLMLSKPSAASQYLELHGDYARYIESLPSQRRYDLRRAYRRAEAAGRVRHDIVTPTPAQLDSMLTTAFEVESRSWKARSGRAVLADTGLREFFFTMSRVYAADGRILIALLYLDDAPIAAQVCLLAHARLWMLKIGYDEAFAKLSPGLILMNEVIRHSFSEKLDAIEFLGAAEDWLDAWRPARRDYRLLALYPYTPRSLVQIGIDAVGTLRRRFARAAPE